MNNIENDVESVVDWVEHSFKQRDSYFQDIMKYEKELEKQDKEIEKLNKELQNCAKLEEQNKDEWRSNRYNKIVWKCKKLEEKYEQCFEELSTKLSEESDFDITRAENEVIKQDKANLLAELTRQINEKQELRNKNRKLTKRRRE